MAHEQCRYDSNLGNASLGWRASAKLERNSGVIPRRPIAITATIMFALASFTAQKTVTTVATGTVLQIQ